MNRNLSNFTVILLSLIFIFFLITNNSIVLESVNFSISIWKDNLFPTLFPFFIVSNILIKYNFVEIISPYFVKPMNYFFKLPGCCCFVLIISLFSGFPSGTKYTVELLKKKKISVENANKLIMFTHFSNPLFVVGFIGNIILNNELLGFIILISHILGGLITGIILNLSNASNITIKTNQKINNNMAFGKILSDSIYDGLNTMFLLLGIITIFSIITALISNLLSLSLFNRSIISGLLEMTQGIKNIAFTNASTYLKMIVITCFISFSGLSVHMQVLSLIANTKIKYKHFFIARILHSFISSILLSLMYIFIN